jgi:hypothetical protein
MGIRTVIEQIKSFLHNDVKVWDPNAGPPTQVVDLANAVRVAFLAHIADVTALVHLHADATSGLAIPAACTDLPTAIALLNALRTGYEAHRVLVGSGPAQVHLAADTTDVIVAPAATDQQSAGLLANDLKTVLNAHEANLVAHTVADGTNAVTQAYADPGAYVFPFAGTVVEYGRKAITRQNNQGTGQANRVVLCPPQGRPGTYDRVFARNPGQPSGGGIHATGVGRPTGTIEYPYEVHCWAFDGSAPNDELAQDDAALTLANHVAIAIRQGATGGVGSFVLAHGGFTTVPVELRFGSEWTFDYVVQISIKDMTHPAAFTSTTIAIKEIKLPNTVMDEIDATIPTPP